MINIKENQQIDKNKNTVAVYEIPKGAAINLHQVLKQKPIFYENNLVTNEVAEVLAGRMIDDNDYKFTHIYGQWGDPGDFPENGGPYITPLPTNAVTDLTGPNFFTTDAQAPIIKKFVSTQEAQAEFSNNVANYIAPISGNNGMSYIGAGLVCRLPNSQELLVAQVALPGIIKKASADLLIVWSFIYTNN